MSLEFGGDILYWRGSAPFYFVAVPEEECEILKNVSKMVTYGWGMIPVKAQIGETAWKTSLFPKMGRYLVPVKDSVCKAETLAEGDEVTVKLEVGNFKRRKS